MIFFRQNIKKRVEKLAKKIQAPESYIPTFDYSEQSGLPHIEIIGNTFYYVVCERGIEFSRKSTNDEKELLYWIFQSITFSMACDLERKNRKENEDFRIQLFQIQEDLITIIDREYALILKDKHEKLLKK